MAPLQNAVKRKADFAVHVIGRDAGKRQKCQQGCRDCPPNLKMLNEHDVETNIDNSGYDAGVKGQIGFA